MSDQVALDQFLRSVEKRAFRIANLAVRNRDDALDIVQDSMLKLARSYGMRSAPEWPPLFFRILSSRITDFHRRAVVRRRWLGWIGPSPAHVDDDVSLELQVADGEHVEPERQAVLAGATNELKAAIGRLPERQQQAFLLRAVEGLDVEATAAAMSCSEGSVKTHYFRAIQSLRAALGEHW